MFMRIWSNWNSHALLVRLQNDTATLEKEYLKCENIIEFITARVHLFSFLADNHVVCFLDNILLIH